MQFHLAGQYVFESQPPAHGAIHLAVGPESQWQIRGVASIQNTAPSCSSHSLPQIRMLGRDWVCGFRKPSSRDTEDVSDSNPEPTPDSPERSSRSFCPVVRRKRVIGYTLRHSAKLFVISHSHQSSVAILAGREIANALIQDE